MDDGFLFITGVPLPRKCVPLASIRPPSSCSFGVGALAKGGNRDGPVAGEHVVTFAVNAHTTCTRITKSHGVRVRVYVQRRPVDETRTRRVEKGLLAKREPREIHARDAGRNITYTRAATDPGGSESCAAIRSLVVRCPVVRAELKARIHETKGEPDRASRVTVPAVSAGNYDAAFPPGELKMAMEQS